MTRKAFVVALFLLGLPFLHGSSAAGSGEVLGVRVEKTRILVRGTEGELVANEGLAGAELVAADEHGVRRRIRIDSIEPYSSDLTGDILLYTFSVRDAAAGGWVDYCRPDPSGRRAGFPLSGVWDVQGNHIPSETEFTVTCTSGAIGKCVMFGYLPWGYTDEGVPLRNYHQACTRLIRADYCGNGQSHTREGTLIELFDRIGIQLNTREPGLAFEAAWNENGAVCLRKTRIPDLATLEQIKAACPEKVGSETTPKLCSESFDDPAVLILTRSGVNRD